MSVAVLPVQPTYMEHYLPNSLSSTLDSDSDTGYGTPAETFVQKQVPEPVLSRARDEAELVLSRDPVQERPGETQVDLDLQERIVKQVEWYFSDENLLKDSFLMKHINRNKQGYVSLKLVASLRKVKTLSKDWKVVLECLRHSDLLALNEDETKICRKSPAPQVDFSHIAKTLLITNYPDEEPNLADVEQRFGRHGEIAQVRLVHPGRAIPLDVKPCKAQHSALGKELCILVQFESEGVAKSALKKIRDQLSWRDEMKVHLLGDKKSAGQESKDQDDKSSGKKKKGAGSESQSTKQKGSQLSKESSPHLRDYSPSLRGSRDGMPIRQVLQRRVSPPTSSPDTHRHSKSHCAKPSPDLSRKYLRPDLRKPDYSSDSGISSCGSRSASESPKLTPEPTRKFFSGDLSWRSADKHVNSCVIRQPLGPDGSKGFMKRRASPISIAVQSC